MVGVAEPYQVEESASCRTTTSDVIGAVDAAIRHAIGLRVGRNEIEGVIDRLRASGFEVVAASVDPLPEIEPNQEWHVPNDAGCTRTVDIVGEVLVDYSIGLLFCRAPKEDFLSWARRTGARPE